MLERDRFIANTFHFVDLVRSIDRASRARPRSSVAREGLARIMLRNLVADKATGFGGA